MKLQNYHPWTQRHYNYDTTTLQVMMMKDEDESERRQGNVWSVSWTVHSVGSAYVWKAAERCSCENNTDKLVSSETEIDKTESFNFNVLTHTYYFLVQFKTRMWANAQPDRRPAEHRWRPLFNAAKFGWRPLLDAVQWRCQDAKPVEICRGAPNTPIDLSR